MSGRLFFRSESFATGPRRRRAPTGETWREAARDTPVHARCDVLVAGGGPAGVAAAVAAAREGARVILLERHNHLGGLSTGGLVIWIDRMTDWQGTPVIRGFAEEFLSRLPPGAVTGPPRAAWGARDAASAAWWGARTAAFHGTVTHSPTCDPEVMKLLAQEMVLEAGAEILFHAWGAEPLLDEGGAVAGLAFESKQGRRAILARVTVDATGDGDLYARAGAGYDADVDERDIHGCMNTAWLFGGVDMPRHLRWRARKPAEWSAFLQRGRERHRFFDKAFVSWRDDVALFMGPRLAGFSAVEVDDLTEVEIRSHRLMAAHLAEYREAPGFENAFLMLSAPQLGVRHARRLHGVATVRREHWDGRVAADEIGVSPSLAPSFGSVSVPYGAIVPARLDGLLAPGRHLSCDATSHSFLREIPQCWLTGQAAGAAAALSVAAGVAPRHLPVESLQAALLRQGAFLRDQSAGSIARPASAAGR